MRWTVALSFLLAGCGRALIQVVDSVDVERIGIVDLIPGEG